MEKIKDVFNYIQKEYPKKLKIVQTKVGAQRRLEDDTIEEKLNEELNKFLRFENVNVKIKLGPPYNRGKIPWIQIYTEENRKGTKGHYAGISFEEEGNISVWIGFGQTHLKKSEIIDKRNEYISEYAKIEMNLKRGFEYERVYVDAVIISKSYLLSNFSDKEFLKDMHYLIDLYKKYEANKKFGIIKIKEQEKVITQETEIMEVEDDSVLLLEKGLNKLYKGYTQNGKLKRIFEEYLYKKDKNGNLIMDKNKKPVTIDRNQYEKVTFYPEYKTENFTYKVDTIIERYVVGPFFAILKKAINYPKMNFFLIIDNFNQGNIFEIFGKTINLLERREDGRSYYEIYDSAMAQYVYGIENKSKSIYLPSNLFILAIENAKEEKAKAIIESKFEIEWVESTNSELDNYYIKGLNNIKWGDLRKIINIQIEEKLNKIQVGEDTIDSYFLPEDRFTKEINTEDEVKEREKFASQLLIYLYENVCRYDHNILFNEKINSIEQLMEKAKSKEYIKIFNEEIQERLKD